MKRRMKTDSVKTGVRYGYFSKLIYGQQKIYKEF